MTRLLLLLGALAATPAAALTCARPDPVSSYLRAEASPDAYGLLLGTLTFDDRALPPPVAPGPVPDPAPVPARFDGHALGFDGFTVPAALDVTIQPRCAGSWCGWIPSGERWLLFAREVPGGRIFEVGPCGGWAFMNPTEAQLDAVAACARGEACPAP